MGLSREGLVSASWHQNSGLPDWNAKVSNERGLGRKTKIRRWSENADSRPSLVSAKPIRVKDGSGAGYRSDPFRDIGGSTTKSCMNQQESIWIFERILGHLATYIAVRSFKKYKAIPVLLESHHHEAKYRIHEHKTSHQMDVRSEHQNQR